MKKHFLLLLFAAAVLTGIAQDRLYVIEFTDKDNSPFSISQPSQYLSQRSIERRTRQGILTDSLDLPPNPAYVDSIRNFGVSIHAQSRWYNWVMIKTADSTLIPQIQNVSFVKNTGRVKRDWKKDTVNVPQPDEKCKTASFDYGASFNQINMIALDFLHNLGYRGDSMVIAVLDAGFLMVDQMAAFDSLWQNNQILGTYDFVQNEVSVFEDHSHGTSVLSVMGGHLPGELVGTAPNASYWLLRSEDASTETISEEYLWVAAAEFADSAGADIINSSLGYTTFDDPSWDHTYADLDGNTTVITRGADRAASRGMLVVNSAGNSGSSSWRYIGAPADGDSVLAVGAVDAASNMASFSSHGPAADGAVKPDVVAQGLQTIGASFAGGVTGINGTSFSSPVMAGAAACLWQAKREAGNMDIMRAIQKSAHKYSNPDTLYGYGIPDFAMGLTILGVPLPDLSRDVAGAPFPNPFINAFSLPLTLSGPGEVEISLSDVSGRLVRSIQFRTEQALVCRYEIDRLEKLAAGIYFLKVRTPQLETVKKLLKQN